jgi:hypothetical protein
MGHPDKNKSTKKTFRIKQQCKLNGLNRFYKILNLILTAYLLFSLAHGTFSKMVIFGT